MVVVLEDEALVMPAVMAHPEGAALKAGLLMRVMRARPYMAVSRTLVFLGAVRRRHTLLVAAVELVKLRLPIPMEVQASVGKAC
jgi:hypothetical protein